MAFDPQRFAAQLLAARATCEPCAPDEEVAKPRSRADAYAIQAVVNGSIGPAGGFKTGRKASTETPIMAPIPRECVRPSPAEFDAREMRLVGVELEIAFRLESAPPDPEDPDFDDRLRAAVSVLPSIEVVDSRLTETAGADPITKLADNQFAHGLVVGKPVPLPVGQPLIGAEITLRTNGALLGSGHMDVPGGDAFATLAAFVRMVGDHCGGLRRGHVVTTGALCGLHFVDKDAEVDGTIAGLGAVSVRFQQAP
jgi:2-keto-4-pentenoate hydratase